MTINENDRERYYQFLAERRESGATNVFGARPYLRKEFPELSEAEARQVMMDWMMRYLRNADITIKVISFGYQHGAPPEGVVVFDCRSLPNPYFETELRRADGRHALVKRWLERRAWSDVSHMLHRATQSAGGGAVVAFGCIGGQHRSVALAEMLADQLRQAGHQVEVDHRDLNSNW